MSRPGVEELLAAAASQRPRLLAVAERVLRDPSEAEDAVQDGLLRALRSLQHFRGEAQLSTWLYRITVNSALMLRRSRRRRPACSLDELCERDPAAAGLGSPEAPEARLAARRDLEWALEALERLPEDQRRALWLRGVLGCEMVEIAAELARTGNAAKMLVHRARRTLRERWAEA